MYYVRGPGKTDTFFVHTTYYVLLYLGTFIAFRSGPESGERKISLERNMKKKKNHNISKLRWKSQRRSN